MKQYTTLNADGSAGEIIDETVLVGDGDDARNVPLAERYHPDFIATLVPYDPKNPPKAAEPPPPPLATSVTMRQARLALLGAGKLDAVKQALDGLMGVEGEAARIEWEFAATVERDSAIVSTMASALKLKKADLDNLFAAAAAL